MAFHKNGAAAPRAPQPLALLRGHGFLWVLLAVMTLLTSSRVILSLEIKGYESPLAAIFAGEALRWLLWLPVVPLVLAVERRWSFVTGSWTAATRYTCPLRPAAGRADGARPAGDDAGRTRPFL